MNTTSLIHQINTKELDLNQRPTWVIGLFGLLLFVIILTSVLGNCLVIAAIRLSHTLQEQVGNMFIINLCITDLSTASVVMCTSLYALTSDVRSIHPVWCNLVCASNYCLIIVSMMTLSCISVERLVAIIHPMRYASLITRPRVAFVCIYIWLQGMAFAVAPVLVQWVHYDYWEAICAINWQYEKQQAVYYVIVAFIVNFAAPGVVILVCYLLIIHEAHSLKKIASQHPGGGVATVSTPQQQQGNARTQKELKAITSLLVVIVLFFIFMTPFCMTKLLKVIVADPDFVPGFANLAASYFGYMSSMVNPFIYGIFRKEFRQAFRLTLRKMHIRFRADSLSMATDAQPRYPQAKVWSIPPMDPSE